MKKDFVKQSRFLSLVLRHKPEKIGIYLDQNGWISVEELLEACRKHGMFLSLDTLKHIVKTNDKQRFSFSEDGQKIRANQGHSVSIDLNLQPKKPPESLYHGTAGHFLPSIRKKGLIKGNRHHVHLSKNPITARHVGQRHGNPVILQILAREMYEDGYPFFHSANGVWLTEFVPIKYIRE
jgi:putative RNA 2'-phosphotransferase